MPPLVQPLPFATIYHSVTHEHAAGIWHTSSARTRRAFDACALRACLRRSWGRAACWLSLPGLPAYLSKHELSRRELLSSHYCVMSPLLCLPSRLPPSYRLRAKGMKRGAARWPGGQRQRVA